MIATFVQVMVYDLYAFLLEKSKRNFITIVKEAIETTFRSPPSLTSKKKIRLKGDIILAHDSK